jgi:hypothetical protein
MVHNLMQSNGEQVMLGNRSNMLLVKDDVGKSKPTCRNLPQPSFVFGKPELFATRETAQDCKFRILLFFHKSVTHNRLIRLVT